MLIQRPQCGPDESVASDMPQRRAVQTAQLGVHVGDCRRFDCSGSGADFDRDVETSEILEFATRIHLDGKTGLLDEGGQKG